jgi:hypothetical protein
VHVSSANPHDADPLPANDWDTETTKVMAGSPASPTTTISGAAPTTTTLIAGRPGCALGPVAAGIACRLGELATTVHAAVPGHVGQKLGALLETARTSVTKADALAGGRSQKKGNALRTQAMKKLAAFEHVVRGRAGRPIPADARARILAAADGIRADLRALGKLRRR